MRTNAFEKSSSRAEDAHFLAETRHCIEESEFVSAFLLSADYSKCSSCPFVCVRILLLCEFIFWCFYFEYLICLPVVFEVLYNHFNRYPGFKLLFSFI